MTHRHLKPKATSFDEPTAADSGWVWDRHRSGGGGAPLKDVTGTPITNLRTIVRGSGEKPSRLAYDDELSSPPKRNSYRDSPDDYDYDKQKDRNRDRDYERDRDYDRNRDRDRSKDNDYRGRNIDRDYNRDFDDHRSYSREGRNNNNAGNFSASPKKGFGAALKELTDGSTLSERDAKARKELEYQQLLKQQIDEKRRKKEEEERKSEEIKQQELEEYLMQYYKGNIPPHLKPSARRRTKKFDDESNKDLPKSNSFNDYDFDKNRDMDYKRNSPTKRDKEIDYNNNSRKHDMPNLGLSSNREIPGLDRKSDRPFERPRDREDRDSGRDNRNGGRDNRDNGRDNRDNGRDNRDNGRDNRDIGRDNRDIGRDNKDGGRWVSQTEYDELSALCENLLFQQKDLQNELKQQATIIKDLQKVGPITSSKSAARSASNKRGPTRMEEINNKAAIGPTRSKSAIQPRKTADSYSEGAKTPRAGGKVAFGSSSSSNYIEPPKTSRSSASVSGGGILKVPRSNGVGASKIPQTHNGRNRSAEHVPRGGLQGFAKLQAKVDGPMVVSHETDDADHNHRNMRMKKAQSFGGSPTMRSTELNGESEYLRIGGEEVDVISSDQLDRLLIQARKVRVGR